MDGGQNGHFGVVTLDGRCQLITHDPMRAFMDLTHESSVRSSSCSGPPCQLQEADKGVQGAWYEALAFPEL